ncbi:hypothetical protein FKM82_017724, partial [Ascaphus truei]
NFSGVLEKPGTCPPEVVLPECAYSRFAPQCLNDSACDGELKCCHSRCTLRCVQPLKEPEVIQDIEKPGTCPPEVYDPECKFSKFPPQCENDSTCDGELKCCHSRCTFRCVKPLQVKLGSCPPTLAKCKTPLPLPRCKSDSQCPGKKKCCTPFCTQQCTDPIMEKPGICPRTLAKCAFPLPPPMCKNDIECPGKKKCCTPFCTQECTDPIENFPV